MSVQQDIAARLKADDLTPDECRELQQQAAERTTELQARLAPIAKGDQPHMPQGLERRRLLTEGTPEELADLNTEHDLITAELEQLSHQRDALTRRRTELLGQAAVHDMPDRYEELGKALDHAATARAAYVASLGEVETLVRGIEGARMEAARAGSGTPTAADPALHGKFDAIAPGRDLESAYLHGRHSEGALSGALVVERPRKEGHAA